MSKIGKQPITIPDGVTVTIDHSTVSVKGPKGELSRTLPEMVRFVQEEGKVVVSLDDGDTDNFNMWGLSRALVANMVVGVSEGYKKVLEFKGVGYRAAAKGDTLELNLGYSHPINVKAPEGISFEADKTTITISGINKELVGQIAAKIRAYRKPEPYKGAGIKYQGEIIRRKAGKKAATA